MLWVTIEHNSNATAGQVSCKGTTTGTGPDEGDALHSVKVLNSHDGCRILLLSMQYQEKRNKMNLLMKLRPGQGHQHRLNIAPQPAQASTSHQKTLDTPSSVP